MPRKIRIGVIFGGRSAEHEVSLVSAASVISALDKKKYEILPIGITPEGRWLSSAKALQLLKERADVESLPEHILVPDPRKRGLVQLHRASAEGVPHPIDVAFPVLHGTYGEDGTIQGLFELADIPYVGAGVLGSAVGMDKVVQKQLLRQAGIPVVEDVSFLATEYEKSGTQYVRIIERKFGYPCFVKPPNLGSSVGITKAHNRRELLESIRLAAEYDVKILVERAVPNAREIECSVLGDDEPIASVPGEIIPSNEFYDYDAKYVDGKSMAIIPAKLTKSVAKKIQRYSIECFKVLNCAGMGRVDFLVERSTNRIYLNELNTIPGFTSISMYPKLWQASGVAYGELLDRLIQLAIERHRRRAALKTRYRPKADWFKS
jgi:D-alanine-D-alanine ligase